MKSLKIKYSSVEWKEAGPGVKLKPVIVGGTGASMVSFEKGASHAPHSHEDTQIVFCLEGAMEFYVKDSSSERAENVIAGDVLLLEGGVTHGARAVEPSLLLVIWNPMSRFFDKSIIL